METLRLKLYGEHTAGIIDTDTGHEGVRSLGGCMLPRYCQDCRFRTGREVWALIERW